MPFIIRSDLDIHLKKDHAPAAAAIAADTPDDIGIGTSAPGEEEARPFAGVKVEKDKKCPHCDYTPDNSTALANHVKVRKQLRTRLRKVQTLSHNLTGYTGCSISSRTLDWVDFHLGCSTFCPVLTRQMGVWQI